jgi:hypothetical protein
MSHSSGFILLVGASPRFSLEAVPEGVSPIAMQSQVAADRFLSPIALIPADDDRVLMRIPAA